MIITHNGSILQFNGQIIDLEVGSSPTPTPTPTITPTPSITPTITPTSTITPTPTPSSGASSALRVLVLGDGNASTMATQISNEIVLLGYPTPTTSAVTISTTYTGSGLTTSNFDVVVYYTNSGQIGATTLTTSLRNFVDSGGNLVTATFLWILRPTNFDYTLTPYVGIVNQSTDSTGNMTVSVVHPITTGVGTNLTSGGTVQNNLVTTLQSGATTIATYTTSGVPLVGINTIGTARLVGINLYFPSYLSTRANLRRLVTNGVLWAGKVLN